MSQHSPASTATPTTDKTTSTEESTDKPSSSTTGSLKELEKKDVEVPITDDFVLMSTPDKFKDKNICEPNAAKRHRTDCSPIHKVNHECLLLSEITEQGDAPTHVKLLLQHFDSTQLSQAEILFLLIYIVSLESGFMAHFGYETAKSYLEELSSTTFFHAKNILRLSRLKPSYKSTAEKTRFSIKLHTLINDECTSTDTLHSLLTGFVTGDLLIVTLSPANSTGGKGFSTALSIGRYVLSIHAKNKALHQRFRKTNELSDILRNQLFVPMRCQQLYWYECTIYPALDAMPADVYAYIFRHLSINQLKILANVNKSLNGLTTKKIKK